MAPRPPGLTNLSRLDHNYISELLHLPLFKSPKLLLISSHRVWLTAMSSPGLPFHLINAFTLTSSPHSGNQAAVVVYPSCAHPKATDEEYMQLVARDFNFAETAFVYPLKGGEWSLRWFTPETVSKGFRFPFPFSLGSFHRPCICTCPICIRSHGFV